MGFSYGTGLVVFLPEFAGQRVVSFWLAAPLLPGSFLVGHLVPS